MLLVDCGSMHNFIQHQLVTQLGLPTRPTSPLRVMVGNGQQLDCHLVCEAIPIYIQSTHFHVDLYVLPISSANIVLGVQWLKSLGPVLTNYNMLVMKFFYDGNLVTLQGDRDTSISSLSAIRRLGQTHRDVLYYHITFLADDAPSSPELLIATRKLLNKFTTLFQPLSTLPPVRDTDHRIHLLPLAAPVNVRPYRYPHYQKQEIEAQVDSML